MLIIFGLLVYGGLAARTARLFAREKPLFSEFGVRSNLGFWVWLLPAPAALLSIGRPIITRVLIGYGIAVLFFIPTIVVAVQSHRRFETTGTDRFDSVQRVTSEVIFAGVIGIAVVVGWCVVYWAIGPLMPP